MDSELIRLKEVSKNIGLSTSTLRKMIKRDELKGVLVGGNYYIRPNDYYEFIYNIECKKLKIPPEKMKQLVEEEQKEKNKELFKRMGFDKLDNESQNLIMSIMSYMR